ncbi:signal peptidase II [Ahrensia sp. R2A130]|uniref:signal peptidase II n=1 Tax=Ahrensia sp. R2A130 TaxID=744979 RepID=UPI0001E0D825|nr:signal peptidase II [Ahrensia sp. R2A130]EFL89782.1 signal peptidase II [Ahrensia sp. R2A130]
MKPRHFIFIAILAAIDQLSKTWVERTLPFQEVVEVFPFFSLYRTHNTGIAFSMLDSFGPMFLVLLSVVIIIFMGWLWRQTAKQDYFAHLGFALVMAGAIGNLIDRANLGYVVDFFLVHTDSWAFAVFNVADSYITCGAIAIILQEFLNWRRNRASAPKS